MHNQGHARLPAKQLAHLTPTNPHSHGGEEQVLLGMKSMIEPCVNQSLGFILINSYYFGKAHKCKMIAN